MNINQSDAELILLNYTMQKQITTDDLEFVEKIYDAYPEIDHIPDIKLTGILTHNLSITYSNGYSTNLLGYLIDNKLYFTPPDPTYSGTIEIVLQDPTIRRFIVHSLNGVIISTSEISPPRNVLGI